MVPRRTIVRHAMIFKAYYDHGTLTFVQNYFFSWHREIVYYFILQGTFGTKKILLYWAIPIKLSLYRIIPLLRHVNLIIQELEVTNHL